MGTEFEDSLSEAASQERWDVLRRQAARKSRDEEIRKNGEVIHEGRFVVVREPNKLERDKYIRWTDDRPMHCKECRAVVDH